MTTVAWQVSRDLVEAALHGAALSDLVALLATGLKAAGIEIAAVEVACDVVDAERELHFMRWSRSAGNSEDIRAFGLFRKMVIEDIPMLRLDPASRLFAPLLQDGVTDALALATHLAPEVTVGTFDDVMTLFTTDRRDGFASAEIDLLGRVAPVFALALSARLNAAAARGLLQTYLGSGAATALLDGRVGLGDVEQIRAIVLYCDLVDFTGLTERLDPHALIANLNLFFATITGPVARAGGQVSGHVGDAVVLFFPIGNAESEAALAAAAVNAALAGLAALESLNALPSRRSEPPLHARIGIDVGDVVHGNIGSAGRFSFTIIGTPVNRATRLQTLAKALGAAVLMTAELAEKVKMPCDAFGTHVLKGFDCPVDVAGFRRKAGESQFPSLAGVR